jgi:peptide/nickel transport system substrate-binding protein
MSLQKINQEPSAETRSNLFPVANHHSASASPLQGGVFALTSPPAQNHFSSRRASGFVIRLSALIWSISLSGLLAGCTRTSDGSEVTMVIEKKVTRLDPRVSVDSADERIRQLIFNSLTRKNEKFEAVPDLAEKIEAAPDFKTFTFRLRPGIKFHHDKPLTSRDVKYTFETLLKLDSGKRLELQNQLDFIETPDDLTVVFRCKLPTPGMSNLIIPIGIIPEGTGDTVARMPIGTGPFKFVSFTEDQEIVLAANETYYEGKPAINRLRVRIIPDNQTRDSELRKGSSDLAINADFDPITTEGLKTAQGVKVIQSDGTNVAHLGINVNDPILKDPRIRQAIAYSLNREAIIRDLLRGQGKPASNILPTAQWAFEPAVTRYDYNLDKARQLLDAAGKKSDGSKPRFEIRLKVSPTTLYKKVAEMIQEQLRQVGIDLKIDTVEFSTMTQQLNDGNYQMYLRVAIGSNQSPDIFKFMYHSKSIPPNGQNRMRYSNPKVDKMIDDALLAPPEKQKQLYAELQKILAEELPQIYLWYQDSIIVQRDRMADFKLDTSGDWSAVRNVKFAK